MEEVEQMGDAEVPGVEAGRGATEDQSGGFREGSCTDHDRFLSEHFPNWVPWKKDFEVQ